MGEFDVTTLRRYPPRRNEDIIHDEECYPYECFWPNCGCDHPPSFDGPPVLPADPPVHVGRRYWQAIPFDPCTNL